MNKKVTTTIGIIIVLAILYYLFSPLWRVVELNEAIPTAANTSSQISQVDLQPDLLPPVELVDEPIMEKDDAMPSNEPVIVSQGSMVASAHEVAGTALLLKVDQDSFLRFQDLQTINGPDLRIYLSNDLEATDSIDLGAIKATVGNVNYAIPNNVDVTQYKYALIWCRAFSVLFSYAELQ